MTTVKVGEKHHLPREHGGETFANQNLKLVNEWSVTEVDQEVGDRFLITLRFNLPSYLFFLLGNVSVPVQLRDRMIICVVISNTSNSVILH